MKKTSIKTELKLFMEKFNNIKANTISSMIEQIKAIENVKDITTDEFNEIYTINVNDKFTIKLKHNKETKRCILGNFIYITDKNNEVIDRNELLKK